MRLKDKIAIREIAGEYIMIAESHSTLDYTQAISLNETARYLICSVQGREFDAETCVDLLLERYDVSAEQARQDVSRLLGILHEAGVLS